MEVINILIFSDIHLEEFRQFSTLKDGMNSRLLDQIYVIKELSDIIKQYKIQNVIFLGDLINSFSSSLFKTVYNAMAYLIQELSKYAHLYIIIGNHDIHRNRHILSPFTAFPNVTIVSESIAIAIEGHEINMVPWGYDIPKPRGAQILMGHVQVKGAQATELYRAEEGISVTEFLGYEYVFLGHFHDRQTLQVPKAKWAGYIGSVLQVNLSSQNEKHGAMILDDKGIQTIDINSPKIYSKTVNNQMDLDVLLSKIEAGNYWRLIITSPDIAVPDFDYRVQVEFDIKPKTDTRLEEIQGEDLIETVYRFIEMANTKVDKELAKELVKEIL